MKKIKNFKLTLERNLGKTIIYQLDTELKKEKIIEILGSSIKEEEKELEADNFLNKIYTIEENTNNIESEYINNTIIDGIELKIDIIYINDTIKSIICKNKIPNEIEKIINILGI